jgi:hypothetical protein
MAGLVGGLESRASQPQRVREAPLQEARGQEVPLHAIDDERAAGSGEERPRAALPERAVGFLDDIGPGAAASALAASQRAGTNAAANTM